MTFLFPGFKRFIRLAALGATIACVLLVGEVCRSLAYAQGNGTPTVIRGTEQSEPVVARVFSKDLRDLPTVKAWQAGDPGRGRGPVPDSQADSAVFSTPELNFEGNPFSGAFPPDTMGEAGPNHYIQMVTDFASGSIFSIYNKSGVRLAGPLSLQSLWTAGGPCASGRGDPVVLYDRLANRWLMSEFADTGNHLCVYISQTPDPISGGWFNYDFSTPGLPDYPRYAVWPDAYYISTNESPSPAVYAIDRLQMLNGQPATSQRFAVPALAGFVFQSLIPSDHDGPAAPPTGSPNYFMRHRDDEAHNPETNNPAEDFLEIWEFRVNFTTPANSTLTGPINIAIEEFDSSLCDLTSLDCFPQPDTDRKLDPLREVIMWRLQYMNHGAYETLVGNFGTDVDMADRGGIRWFELRKTGNGAWTLFQEGTHSPDANNRWAGSIAMDKDGNIALAYSVSSSTVFPSIRYAGRLAGDTAGQLQAEATLIGGGASQTTTNRWGDDSSLSLDPTDDCTFWYTNEFIPADTGGQWRTRVGSFKFDTCQPYVVPAISITDAGVSEGNSSTKNLQFLVSLSAPSAVDVFVNYKTADSTTVSAGSTANTESISIPSLGSASPYPSTISVPSGLGLLTNLKVKLNQFSHTFPQDVDILLVGPGGESVVLMSDVSDGQDAVNLNFTFDDTAPPFGSGALTSGSYKPTNIDDGEGADTFSVPAPAGPYGTTLSVFNGANPTGTWQLFVRDDLSGDFGTLSGGWSLELTPGPVSDYTSTTGLLTFTPGMTQQFLNVSILGDTTVEPTETFFVNLTDPVNAIIGDGQAIGTIHNDDGSGTAPAITSHPAGVSIQGGQTATLAVDASGTAPLTYQWYLGASGDTTDQIAGTTFTSFTTPPLSVTTSYWVLVTNGFGTANSNTATVTVSNRRRGQITSQ